MLGLRRGRALFLLLRFERVLFCGGGFLDREVGRGIRGGSGRRRGSEFLIGGSRWGVSLRGGGVLRVLDHAGAGIARGR